VLFAAYYFPPRGGAGVQRSLKFVKYLRRQGWEPTVLTTGYSRRSAAYDESLAAEVPEGTEVVSVPSDEDFFVRLSRAGLGRAAGFVLRPDTAVTWVRRALAVARRLHVERPFDAVYTSVQPWSIGLLGMDMKRRFGLPWVVDFRDPWSRSMHLVWPTKIHWLLDRRLERQYLEAADVCVVVTPTMADGLREDHPGVDASKIRVIQNGYDVEDADAAPEAEDGKFTVVFTGKFQYDWSADGGGRGLRERLRLAGTYERRDVMLDTHSPIYFLKGLEDFLRRRPQRRPRVRAVFAGLVGRGNEALVGELGLSDVVECPGYLPHTKSVALARSADALLLPMFTTKDGEERVPYASGKVYEYIAARRPILALAQAGDARDVALGSGLGLAAPPRDVDAISRAIEELYDAWEACSRRFAPNEEFIGRFTREALTAQLAEALDEASAKGGRR
jgi:glycosyltransferase involved in cell wall biosynthesis